MTKKCCRMNCIDYPNAAKFGVVLLGIPRTKAAIGTGFTKLTIKYTLTRRSPKAALSTSNGITNATATCGGGNNGATTK